MRPLIRKSLEENRIMNMNLFQDYRDLKGRTWREKLLGVELLEREMY